MRKRTWKVAARLWKRAAKAYRADIARMRPVVEACETSYDEGWLVGNVPVSRAVEAYRASGKENNMTPEQREAQRRSFVYGNTKMANDSVTPELVNDVADGKVEPEPPIPLPDVQRNYRPPENDTAERIADDVTSTEPPAIPAWVVRRRIEALVDDGIRGSMLRIAIACDIHEACWHVVDDIAEAIERLKRDRSLLAAITAEERRLEVEANAYRKHFRAVASAIGAHITEDEWGEMTPATAERVAADVESYADRADALIRAALEAAAERAAEWWNGTNSSTASLRRAVMGGEE